MTGAIGVGKVVGHSPASGATLEDWLVYIGHVHPSEMELGLGRVSRVAMRAGLAQPPFPVATIGGTNGKGSTVAMLESIWTAAGYRTGAATSPHVTRFAERVRVGGREADDGSLVRAFERVEAARTAGDGTPDTLTYFEFATLASMAVFVEAGCEVAIMEVGLGGRLDAVNLWDADVAALTSIALDHADWLGSDVSVIATEKAAIGRAGRPLVVGERSPPDSLAAFARSHDIALVDVGSRPLDALPETSLVGEHQRRNAACALAVVQALEHRLPVADAVARAALQTVSLVARFDERAVNAASGRPVTTVIDVAHNPAGAQALASAWQARFGAVRGIAVFAALADKDIEAITAALAPCVSCWCCASLAGARATPIDTLAERVRSGLDAARADNVPADAAPGVASIEQHGSVEAALERALALGDECGVPVLVAGSFVTVTDAEAVFGRRCP